MEGKSLKEEIIYRILSGSIIFIEDSRQRKRELLNSLILAFRGGKKVAYVNCELVKNLNIDNVLMGKYNFITRLFKKKPKGMILFLDNVQELSWKNCERIKYHYDEDNLKSVVLIGRSYENVNIPQSMRHRIGRRVYTL